MGWLAMPSTPLRLGNMPTPPFERGKQKIQFLNDGLPFSAVNFERQVFSVTAAVRPSAATGRYLLCSRRVIGRVDTAEWTGFSRQRNGVAGAPLELQHATPHRTSGPGRQQCPQRVPTRLPPAHQLERYLDHLSAIVRAVAQTRHQS